ncbi:IS66 family transposase [Mesorhizobium sp. Cs1299R1N1]|uniref:IS66 family transposase n=1 Tax=Mesorhizobium sp. Cs1299R1N1 TaxID=3015172 RepID=UPI00301B7DBC
MVLARDVENARLVKIIKELQRHRFGRRAETLPEDQLHVPDRKAERPIAHLAGFTGILQVDGYGGYRVLAEKSGITLAFCWAHVRRRFYELAVAGPAPIASEMLRRIAELYKIEDGIRGRSADERRAARQERSPDRRRSRTLAAREAQPDQPETKLAEAITLSRWEGLVRFLDDGRIEIDSNTVERSILPIALNRKNALFAGSDGGAEHWAVVASLIENGVEPLGYLTDILTRIVNGHPTARSTISCPGLTSAPLNSGPWRENIALMSAVKVWNARARPIRGTAAHSDNRAWVEAELKDLGDQALMRGLATAFPIVRPGLFLSYWGRRTNCRPQCV